MEAKKEVKKILFVDDEEKVLHSLERELRNQSFKKLFANSGKQALEILEKNDVNVIVADIKMPEMSGLDLLRIVKEKYPDVTRVVLSGYNYLGQVIAIINSGEIYKYIPKPWKYDAEFMPALEAALEENERKTGQKKLLKKLEQKNELVSQMLMNKTEKLEQYNVKHNYLAATNDKIRECFENGIPEVGEQEENFLGWALFTTYQDFVDNYLKCIETKTESMALCELVKDLEKIHEKVDSSIEIKTIGNIGLETNALNEKIFIWVIERILSVLPTLEKKGVVLFNVVRGEPEMVRIIRKIKVDPKRRLDFSVMEKYVSLLNLLISDMDSEIAMRNLGEEVYVEFDHVLGV